MRGIDLQRLWRIAVLGPLVFVSAFVLGGCPPPPLTILPPPEFLPSKTLVANYNTRADAIGKLWSKCHIEIRIPTFESGKPQAEARVTGSKSYALDGNFILRKPRDLYLEGRTLLPPTPVFGLFSNSERYWLWVKPDVSTEWSGRYDGPGASKFFMRPDRLLQAMGLLPLPTDGPVLFCRNDTHDELIVIAKSPDASPEGLGHSYIAEEIYLNRSTHLPDEVRLYNDAGDPVIISTLSDYAEVDGQQVPRRIVARFIQPTGPRAESTVTLELSSISLTKEVKDAAFAYRPADVDHRVDLDAGR
jgi:hypothetical protein